MEEIFVYDMPLVKTQWFSVSIPGQMGRVKVMRKETVRQLHNMNCIDGLPKGYEDHKIQYELYREVDPETEKKAIEAVEAELSKLSVEQCVK